MDKNNLQRVQNSLLGVREGHKEWYSDFGRVIGTFQLFPKYTVEIFGLRESSYSQDSERNSPGSAGGAESWLRKRIVFHDQCPRLAFGAAPHQGSESQIPGDSSQRKGLNVGQLAPEEFLQTLTEGQRWADPWLVQQRCGELGSCSFHLPAWGKAGRWIHPGHCVQLPMGLSRIIAF